ncbi:aspartate aminotransferase family protein [Paraglaciecola arctica]|uniref:DegT/DnrJ/EryC1/StrS aminotransferase family protein n=1 Tax=Paraglaciecola arctica BSs20135 TaxID=493475 RepID=K6Y3L4_9ALTE|nr:DegT/DnrJ/EryC1/StrS aminotransferase family protein [Paraglaciecola arctica]GAC18556.1 hypothetical protein GARC_1584 [Paraglaciecola arctica BSs20135]
MTLFFTTPIANARDYPLPHILGLPSTPEITTASKRWLLNVNNHIYTMDSARSGLYILATSLRSKSVWLPSYHCPALVEPFLAAGITVNFYPICSDLKPDFNFLNSNVGKFENIVGIRYFGFDCGIEKLSEFCKKNQNILIEDLAHAAFPSHIYGQAAVTSLVKFYPLSSGAELIVNSNFEAIEKVQENYANLPKKFVQQFNNLYRKVKCKLGFLKKKQWLYLDIDSMTSWISAADELVLSYTDHINVKKVRRDNYQVLANRLANNKYGTVLFPELDSNTVPYVLPFLIHDEAVFVKMRKAGIQIYRWEELAESRCQQSKLYRQKIIQIPCHQNIEQSDIDYIIQVLNQ